MTTEAMSNLKQMRIHAEPPTAAGSAAPPTVPTRRGDPRRGVERYNSGGQLRMMPRRAPPKRSQSHRIGRPAFSKDPPAPADHVPRTVSRSNSKNFTRAAPLRTNSYTRAVPDRSSSTSSLRAYRRQQHSTPLGGTPLGQQIEVPYSQRGGDCDNDSVFTSASNQTLDSIMLRKKQIDGNDVPVAAAAMKRERPRMDSAVATFEFDESLHTVDSIKVHMRNVHQVLDEACDLSVFSESFASTETYMLSDYEEDEEDDDDDDDEEEDEDDDDEDDDNDSEQNEGKEADEEKLVKETE